MAVKEVTFEREYNAPIEKVWQAWTDPNQLKNWWGPNDVLIPECEVDLKVGGRFYIVMEASEAMGQYKGTRWPMDGHYTEIEENSKLAYDSKAWTEGQEDAEIEQTTILTLSEQNGKTKLALTATVHKMGENAKMAIEGMQYGFSQQLDKLATFLS